MVVKTSVSLPPEIYKYVLDDSKLMFGKNNVSGYVAYLINKEHEKQVKKLKNKSMANA